MRAHPITFLFVVCMLVVSACTSKKELKAAKSSVYNTDFAVVYNAALNATRELYPTLNDSPGPGLIKTAWHQVQYSNNADDVTNTRTMAAASGVNRGAAGQLGGAQSTRLAYKRYFIRFDVSVVGGRPWRVKVVGHASEWEPGNALPTELQGPARPHWLAGRTDALTVAIYKKIKPYAVPATKQEAPVKVEPDKTDPNAFGNIAPTAGAQLAKLRDALVERDVAKLRTVVAPDVIWSAGGSPGIETAMALWQADPEPLDAMARVLARGCGGTDTRVSCPAGDPRERSWQLVLELRGTTWLITSFIKRD